VVNEDGVRELRIDYGLKEISFDEERLFPFGEQLVREASFTGEAATTWGPGYSWEEIGPLLEVLVEEGIIKRGEVVDDTRGGGLVPSLLPPSVCPVARSWSLAECESLTQELGGRAIEIGYLEAVVPVFRIAHPALDGDGRQVGEGNVYPSRLRLDRETEWRVCQYSGSRYRDDAPMNVTALRAMIKHWKPMMATALAVRAELRGRLGLEGDRWTIGELHTFSSIVLGVPTYQLMKRGGATPQQPLHPVLSSLFRITDGIRMTTYAMLFGVEHPHRGDAPLTATELYTHAEQTGVFIGETGVCAGPKPLIDEFLTTVIDGVPAEGIAGLELPAEISAALAELPAAVDYGLYAMQSWGVSLSVFLGMSRAYEAILAVLEATVPAGDDRFAALRRRMRAEWHHLAQMQITIDHDRDVHFKAYQDAYERSWQATRTRVGQPELAREVAPGPERPMHAAAADQLRGILRARFAPAELGAAEIDRIVGAVIYYLREEQAVLASTTRFQDTINALLDRPRPTRPLSVRDFHANYIIGAGPGAFPYLLDVLDGELGIHVDCTADTLAISDRRAAPPAPAPTRYASTTAGGS
jgi:hypothetical protein